MNVLGDLNDELFVLHLDDIAIDTPDRDDLVSRLDRVEGRGLLPLARALRPNHQEVHQCEKNKNYDEE